MTDALGELAAYSGEKELRALDQRIRIPITLKYNEVGKARTFVPSRILVTQGQEMNKGRIRFSLVALSILVLLLTSTPPCLFPANAQPQECHLDQTGKICGIFLRPGVRDEYKSTTQMGWSHTLDTLRGNQGGEGQRRQVIERYQDYAILSSMSDSIGDLQFDIWVANPVSDIRIYVPSNFTFAYVSSGYGDATTQDKVFSVWTDITNDYSYVSVGRLSGEDPIAPGWHVVEVGRIPAPTAIPPIPSFMILPGLYHIRLFQMRAPFVAGLYHFKVYVDGLTIGDGNFPIIIVKSSLQPAYVTGLVALRRLAPATNASGRVIAVGTMISGRLAEAVGYFGPKDFEKIAGDDSYFRYWLFGLPAGTFELTASASGYLKTSSRIAVDPGQSLTHDFELERGLEISVTIWSKCGPGAAPWANLWQPPYGTNNPFLAIDDGAYHRDVLIRLLDQYEQTAGYWGSDDIDPPYGPPASTTVDGKRNYSRFILKPSTVPSSTSYTTTLTDVRGLPSVTLDGHVPADTADLIEGIEAGHYELRIQITGYVMRDSDSWQRVFTATPETKTHAMQVDVVRTSWIMATSEFMDASFAPVAPSTIVVVAESTDNLEKGLATTRFPAGATQFTIVLEGFNGIYNRRPNTDYQDYGLPPADYRLEVYMADFGSPFTGNPGRGWYLVDEDQLDVQTMFCGPPLQISFHLRPSAIELFLRSIILQQPMQPSPWTFPGAGIRVVLIDELGSLAGFLEPAFYGLVQDDGTITGDPYDIDTSPIGRHALLRVRFTGIDPSPLGALGGSYPTRVDEGKYFVNVATLGYIQRVDHSVYVEAGIRSDLQIDLVQGAQIRVELNFRHEGVPTVFNGFVRVELYDQEDMLVGASIYAGADPNPNLTYLPYDPSQDWKLVQGAAEGAGTGAQPQRAFISLLHYGIPPVTWANWPAMTPSDANRLSVLNDLRVAFDVFGFHWYYGGPDSRNDELWANGWDTTDGTFHLDSGIRGSRDNLNVEGGGTFTLKVWAFDPYGPDGVFDSIGPDGIFGTEDDYTSPDPVDAGLSDFRAYSQLTDVQGIEAPWGGAAVLRITLEEQPSMLGLISWTDMFGDVRRLAWAQVIENSPGSVWTSSTDGRYRIWLSPGSHEIFVTTIEDERLWEPFYFDVVLDRMGVHTTRDIILTSSAMEAPEYASPSWIVIAALAALFILLRRRNIVTVGGRQRLN